VRGHPFWFLVAFTLGAVAIASTPSGPGAPLLAASRSALGVDVDVYTGPVARDVWRRMKRANVEVVVAQTWGGRSRNEFAASQLAGARRAGLKTAACVLLNYDNRVCPTHASPVRDAYGATVRHRLQPERRADRIRCATASTQASRGIARSSCSCRVRTRWRRRNVTCRIWSGA
jgi:hypothetical protein